MGHIYGSGYFGSPDLQTSIANEEVLPATPPDHTLPYNFLVFSLANKEDCRIKINNGTPIFFGAGQGIHITHGLQPIHSIKFVESGITFNWFGSI